MVSKRPPNMPPYPLSQDQRELAIELIARKNRLLEDLFVAERAIVYNDFRNYPKMLKYRAELKIVNEALSTETMKNFERSLK